MFSFNKLSENKKNLIAFFKISVIITVLIFLTATFLIKKNTSLDNIEAGPHNESVPGEILVKFRPDTTENDVSEIRKAHGMFKLDDISQIKVERFKVTASSRDMVLEALQKNPHIEYAELNYLTKTAFNPNDTYFVDNTQWAPQKIQAPEAWNISKGQGVTIAILDSGIDPNHPDLAGKLVPGYNFYDNNTNTVDDCSHGTGVAGIAAAITNNALGIAGIAPDSMVMPIKIASECGGNYSSMASGIVYAADQGARVINISMGGSFDLTYLSDAVNYARSKGAIVIAPVGNDNSMVPFYPASYPAVFAVAGTLRDDTRYLSSNYGSQVDVAAPASSIYTTFWTPTNGSIYTNVGGTSDAAPHVAGLAALLFAKNPNYSVSDVESIIETSADDLGTSGWDMNFGCGRINAYKALTLTYDGTSHCRALIPTDTPIITPSFTPTPTMVSLLIKVSILLPANASVIPSRGSFKISASSSSTAGTIKSMQLQLDGQNIQTCKSSSCQINIKASTLAPGMHIIKAYATDTKNNQGSSFITVTK